MKKLLGTTVVALILVLSGCGGSSDVSSGKGTTSPTSPTSPTSQPTTDPTTAASAGGPYCDALNNAKATLSGVDFSKLTEQRYQTLTDELTKVADASPADVHDDWQVLLTTLDDLHTTLASAGITFDDLAGISAGNLPAGVDAKKLQQIAPKLQKITTDSALQTASKSIQTSAKDQCGLSLN